ncbi:MAG: DUF1848 domain-containing protein [Lachnotalea sp.]
MILSVSRRTDIPNYYSEWFLNRIKEGFLYVRNPFNLHQISKIDITPNIVDCIVFWTKNPKPMMNRLDELNDYKYYFQFTLTGYGKDMEPNLPRKRNQMIPIFQELSGRIGKEKVIWRYDPIIITDKYTIAYHTKAFTEIAEKLNGYTDTVIISFVDSYAKTKKSMEEIKNISIETIDIKEIASKLAKIAKENNMQIETCAEKIDLSAYGIEHSSCIDKKLVEKIIGCNIKVDKDKNQRADCGCVESVEVGSYNTCKNGCKYCYANYSYEKVKASCELYDVTSPILCGKIGEKDSITERKINR